MKPPPTSDGIAYYADDTTTSLTGINLTSSDGYNQKGKGTCNMKVT